MSMQICYANNSQVRLLGAKPANFLIVEDHKLALATNRVLNDATWYRRLVGQLIYLTTRRLELTYADHILSQFVHSPKEITWRPHVELCVISSALLVREYFFMLTVIFSCVFTVTQIGERVPFLEDH